MASIRKRSWKSGSETKTAWVADYTDQHGKRRLKTFKAKKEADSWMVSARHQVSQGTHIADSASVTVSEAVRIWLEACEKVGRRGREPVEPHTLRVYRTHGEHIKALTGAIKLNKLTGPTCVQVRDRLLERLSRRNAAKVLTSFKSVLREARARGLMTTDPAEDVSIVISARQRDRLTIAAEDRAGQIPSPAQVGRILATADQVLPLRDRALVYTIPLTGLRLSEARGFCWPNYNPDALTMRITQRADERGNIGPPKTAAGYRIIHLPPELREILKDWREHCPISPDQLMFPNGKERPESGANLHNRVWKPLMTAAGLVDKNGKPLFDIKSLRHFYASYRIAQGADPKQIQTEMGHSNVVVTLGIYGHLFPDETGKRAARASAMGADLVRLRQKVATSSQHANKKILEISIL